MKAFTHGHYPGVRMPRHILPGLLSVGYWNAERKQDWGLDWHRNEGLELSFLRSGAVEFATASHSQTLLPHNMTICGPWQLHRVGTPFVDAGTFMWLIFDQKIHSADQQWSWPHWIVLTKQDLDELTRLLLYNSQPVYLANSKMVNCWEQLFHAVQSVKEESRFSRIAVTVNELLLLLLTFLRDAKKPGKDTAVSVLPPALHTVKLFWDDLKSIPHLLEKEWSVKEMAQLCSMSESHFTQCCRKLTNMSPSHFLNHCRIQHALSIMERDPQRSIMDIALDCGFTTSQYFATVFKKITGKTPSSYSNASRKGTAAD
ncbi:MAG: helix-turn-helix transcriptional regulator [Planctomycetaceae bacterium]|nr:helix-turn-helix transcriptional regulator [Planctomycetaceae bacterium]